MQKMVKLTVSRQVNCGELCLQVVYAEIREIIAYYRCINMIPTRTGKTGEHFPVRESQVILLRLEKREFFPKYWKSRGFLSASKVKSQQIWYHTLNKKELKILEN